MTNHIVRTCQTTLIQPSSAAAERVFSLLANSFNSNQESALEYYIQASCYARNDWNYGLCVGALWSIMGGVWEHYGWCVRALWVVCGSIMGGVWEHYGWCVGALEKGIIG